MPQRVFRAARLALLFPPAALAAFLLIGGLLSCAYFVTSPIVVIASVALLAFILFHTHDRISAIWRQTLILEGDHIIYFDGQTRYRFLFAEIRLIRLNRWTGSLRQNEGHSLVLLPRGDGKIEHWDVSDFSLRAALRLVCELAGRADGPPIEICQTEFKEMKAELQRAVRELGAISSLPLDEVDESTLSFYEKEFRQRERRYLFEPNR